jgi:hypothetical protein
MAHKNFYLKKTKTNKKYKKGWWSASSGRMPAKEAPGPEFNPQHQQKKKREREKKKESKRLLSENC